MTTNYVSAFIAVSPDCPARAGTVPAKEGSVARLQHALLSENPYGLTSDDLLFEVQARRRGIPAQERAAERAAFFSKPQACLRASPLVKQFGWGLHHDENGKVALYGVETEAYAELSGRDDLKRLAGMRSKKV